MLESHHHTLRIGDKAPDFTAQTTQGNITLSDWQEDKWVILFSHPADFTPVCSTELTEFAKRNDDFTSLHTKLIGLSIDSIHSHLAWVENLKEITGTKIPYPLIADLNTSVAQKYGMIHPGEASTATVRALFIIDPTKMIRAIIYYPLNIGRNVDEVLRLLEALQVSDKHSVACPVNWKKGEQVVLPPPKTEKEVQERKETMEEMLDFYICKKDLLIQ